MSETLLLSRSDVATLLEPADVAEAVERGFRAYASGQTLTPPRIHLEPPGRPDIFLAMPCATRDPRLIGTKLVTVYRGNAALGLPTVASVYLLTDYDTGMPLAVMDGTYLTAVRTAAASAVATRALARPDSAVLGIVGTGTLAEFHLLALPAVRPFRTALVAGRTSQQARDFADRLAPRVGLSLEAVASADQLVPRADVIVTATSSRTPVFDGRLVRPGTHLNAVGGFPATHRELDGPLVARSAVFVDTLEGALREAGELVQTLAEGLIGPDHVRAELGDVLLGRKPGRTAPDVITVFRSVGAAFEDAVTAHLAYQRALARRIGVHFAFW